MHVSLEGRSSEVFNERRLERVIYTSYKGTTVYQQRYLRYECLFVFIINNKLIKKSLQKGCEKE